MFSGARLSALTCSEIHGRLRASHRLNERAIAGTFYYRAVRACAGLLTAKRRTKKFQNREIQILTIENDGLIRM